jgi:hypothetical protein
VLVRLRMGASGVKRACESGVPHTDALRYSRERIRTGLRCLPDTCQEDTVPVLGRAAGGLTVWQRLRDLTRRTVTT